MKRLFFAGWMILLPVLAGTSTALAQGGKVKSQVGGRAGTTTIKDATATPKADRLLVDRVLFLANLETVPTLDAFFGALPAWAPREGDATLAPSVRRITPQQNAPKAVGGAEDAQEKEGNRTYKVTRERYSLTTTPEAIVSFDPAAEFFWPGSLLQEKGLRGGLGSLNPIPNLENKRAPLRVFVVNPNVANGSRDVANPNGSSVGNAVGELREMLNGREIPTSSNFQYTRSDSLEQSALSLGIDARYMTGYVKSVFGTKHTAREESINGTLMIKGYTIAMEPQAAGWRGFFSEGFTLADAQQLARQKAIDHTNLPCYVATVTYGTIVAFNMKRTLTEDELKAKVQAGGSIGFASADVSVAGESLRKDEKTTITFTTIGGPADNVVKAASSSAFNQVIQSLMARAPKPSEMAPISYSVRSLKDRALASMMRTTEYVHTEYAPNPAGETYELRAYFKINDSDDGVADNTVECYGEGRINGAKFWEIPRSQADTETNKREKGGTIDIAAFGGKPRTVDYYYDTKEKLKLDLRLMDYDGSSADDLLGEWKLEIDPLEWSKRGEVILVGPTERDGRPQLLKVPGLPVPGFPDGVPLRSPAELHIVLVRKGYL